MRGINIDGLVEGESNIARVDRSISGGVWAGNRSLGQTGDELLHPTDTLSADSRVSRAVSVPESQVYTPR